MNYFIFNLILIHYSTANNKLAKATSTIAACVSWSPSWGEGEHYRARSEAAASEQQPTMYQSAIWLCRHPSDARPRSLLLCRFTSTSSNPQKTIERWLTDPTIIITTDPICDLHLFDLQHALKGANMESEVCGQCGVLISSAHFPVVISHLCSNGENISAQDTRTACVAASTRQLHPPCKWTFITADNHQLAGSLAENVIVQCEAVRMTAFFFAQETM